MISLNGESLYVSLSDYDRSQVSPWLKDNVISQIDERLSTTSLKAAAQIQDWFEKIRNGEKIHLISFGKAQDIILLFELWKQFKSKKEEFHYLHDLPEYLNHSEHLDFCTLLVASGIPLNNFDKVKYANLNELELLHNALYDAKLLRAAFVRLLTESSSLNPLNKRVGLELYDPNLFKYETNISFPIKETNVAHTLFENIHDYIDEKIVSIKSIQKNSIDSSLFLLNGEKGNYVARVFDQKEKQKVEAQCDLVNTSAGNLMLSPMRSKKTLEFVTTIDDRSIIVYPYISGSLFDGNPKKFDHLFRTINDLITEFSFASGVDGLPKFNYSEWNLDLINLLKDKNSFIGYLRDDLTAFTYNFFNVYHMEIIRELDWVISQTESLRSNSIVHADLNHANILMTGDLFKIIDIEDVGFSNKEVALAHFVFKSFRHSIYQGHINLSQFIELFRVEYENTLTNLTNFQKLFENFYFFGVARIYYDLHLILDYFLVRGDRRYMYDLNKKVSNLIEFKRMFFNGFKT